jgi:hypothetical protein
MTKKGYQKRPQRPQRPQYLNILQTAMFLPCSFGMKEATVATEATAEANIDNLEQKY